MKKIFELEKKHLKFVRKKHLKFVKTTDEFYVKAFEIHGKNI